MMARKKCAPSKRRPPNTKARSAADVLADIAHWRHQDSLWLDFGLRWNLS